MADLQHCSNRIDALIQYSYTAREADHSTPKPFVVTQANHQTVDVFDVCFVQSGFAFRFCQRDAGLDNDQRVEKAVGGVEAAFDVAVKFHAADLGFALNVAQRVGHQIHRRPVGDEVSGGGLPVAFAGIEQPELDAEARREIHRLRGVKAAFFEYFADSGSDKLRAFQFGQFQGQCRLSSSMRAAKSNVHELSFNTARASAE